MDHGSYFEAPLREHDVDGREHADEEDLGEVPAEGQDDARPPAAALQRRPGRGR